MPDIVDRFDGREPCVPWGQQFGNAALEIHDQVLTITPAAEFQNSGGCLANEPIEFRDGGIFLEVPAVLPAGRGFVAIATQGGATAPSLVARDGRLALTAAGDVVASAPYDATAMRWWRLRPDRVAGATIAEYAADGRNWTQLGVLDVPPEPAITFELSGGTDAPDPSPATARIAQLGVCPALR